MKGLALELIRAPGRSIDLVSQQRVSQARHMDTDLMGTAGFQTALNMGKARKALQHPVMGHRRLAVLVVDAHFFPVLGMTANGGVYDTLVLLHHSMDNGLVPSGYGMLLQLGGNGIVGLVILAGDEDTSGIHVNAVDDPRTQDTVDPGQILPAVVHQSVYKRARIMPGRRMDHHALGLIHQDLSLIHI